MQALCLKKEQEVKYSRLFLLYINREMGWDYKPVPNEDEERTDNYVDVYAKSRSLATLNLQVKIIDRDYPYQRECRAKEAEKNLSGGSSIYVRDLNTTEWAKQSIETCNNKYAVDVRKELVLLLCVFHATQLDPEYARKEFMEYQDSDFKGIYLIIPTHDLSSGGRKYFGQITPVKLLTA